MDVNSTSPAVSGANAGRPAAAAQTAVETAPVATSDFQTFLTLLTAQMRNQDPLQPLESTEFVAQLASFSTVEQQVRTNDRLDRIAEALGGGTAAGLAAWIGREVRAPVAANFQGVPVEVAVAPRPGADRAMLVVTNAADQEVARLPLDLAKDVVSWDGQTAAGTTVAHGSYRFEVVSYQGEEIVGTTPGSIFTEVNEVRIEEGGPALVLATGARVSLDEVSGVR